MTDRLQQLTKLGDVDAARSLLVESKRRGDISGELDACSVLVKVEADTVRAALRSILDRKRPV